MSEHTPGPWTVDDSGNVCGADGRLAANCGGWQNSRMTCRRENMANAHLVGAAPDLEYELGGIADLLAAGDTVTIEPGSVKAARIAAAIAKAKQT